MSEQATFVPLPRKRLTKSKLPAAIKNVEKLIAWYKYYKPEVKRVVVYGKDYRAFDAAADEQPLKFKRTTEGILYDGFLIQVRGE